MPESLTGSLSVGSIHGPAMYDMDEAVKVNVKTRDFLFAPNFSKIVGVVGDHNSSIVSFRLPRYIDGHDISACAEHMVFWQSFNIDEDDQKIIGAHGSFQIRSIKTSEDEDGQEIALLEWLLSSDVTASECCLEFSLAISDYDDGGNLAYRWKTRVGSGLLIVEGDKNVSPTPTPMPTLANAFTMIDHETGDKYMLYVSGGKLKMDLVV